MPPTTDNQMQPLREGGIISSALLERRACVVCSNLFYPKRKDGVTCSEACRTDKQYRRDYMQAYYQKNRSTMLPILLARGKAWKDANREKVREAGRKYSREHKEQSRAWYVANKEKVIQCQRKNEKKAVAELRDTYIRKGIARRRFPTKWVTPEMVEVKRTVIKLKRLWLNQQTSNS